MFFTGLRGDDPLLTQEACDTVRAKARAKGFAERKVFFVDKKEHWQEASCGSQCVVAVF